jgi:hypothetical protein
MFSFPEVEQGLELRQLNYNWDFFVTIKSIYLLPEVAKLTNWLIKSVTLTCVKCCSRFCVRVFFSNSSCGQKLVRGVVPVDRVSKNALPQVLIQNESSL